MTKADSALSPLGVSCHDIFGNKRNLRRLADELVLVRVGIRRDQGKHRRAVRRRNPDPALSRLKAHIKGQAESQLIHVESQAPVLIANENVDRVNPKMGVLAIERRSRAARPNEGEPTMAGIIRPQKQLRYRGMQVHNSPCPCIRTAACALPVVQSDATAAAELA